MKRIGADKNYYDLEEFIRQYMESYRNEEGYIELAEKVGIAKSTLKARLNNMKKAGVQLPQLVNGALRLRKKRVAALNRLIEKELPTTSVKPEQITKKLKEPPV